MYKLKHFIKNVTFLYIYIHNINVVFTKSKLQNDILIYQCIDVNSIYNNYT